MVDGKWLLGVRRSIGNSISAARLKGRFAADDEILPLERLESGKKICRFLCVEVPVDVLVAGMIDDTDLH